MNQPRIQKLEALLARIRRNRSAPAPTPAAVAPRASLPTPAASTPAPRPVASAPAHAPGSAAPFPLSATPPTPAVTFASTPPVRIEPQTPATTPSWRPEPGSAVQPRPSTMPPMEIGDDDLIEVTTLPPAPEPAAAADSEALEAELDVEQPPASSRRSKVDESFDEAIANASPAESDREIPIKTPPPESGPQEALPATGLEAPRLPDVENLEADLSGPASMGPTAEQLGETIELEAPRGPELEIDVTLAQPEPEIMMPAEELEVTLPRPSLQSGLYDVSITAPPAAPAPEAHVAITVPAAAVSDQGPARTGRPALGATDVAEVRLATPAPVKTFLELLDGSLAL